MSDFKNIIEKYEENPDISWNKDANWNTISKKINQSPKNYWKNKLLLFSGLISFFIAGFFLEKYLFSPHNKIQSPKKIDVLENKLNVPQATNPIDSINFVNIKADAKYKKVYVQDNSPNRIIADTVYKIIEIDPPSLLSKNTQAQNQAENIVAISPANSMQILNVDTLKNTNYTNIKRTRKKYAQEIFFEDVAIKSKHEFRFINRLPVNKSSDSRFVNNN